MFKRLQAHAKERKHCTETHGGHGVGIGVGGDKLRRIMNGFAPKELQDSTQGFTEGK
jgi:hypothetical protein